MIRPRGASLRRRKAAMLGPAPSVYPVSKTSGSARGTLSNYFPQRTDRFSAPLERVLTADRAEDLVANDPHAASVTESLSVNVVGTGLRPQSRLDAARLGLSDEQAMEIQSQAERAWAIWCREADAGERMHFQDMQFLAARSMFTKGEYAILPVMLKSGPRRAFSLALQALAPNRLCTPSDKEWDRTVRDGVELGERGEPTAYWIANPDDGIFSTTLTSGSFTRYPAWIGHRPGFFHGFYTRDEEQVRGVSILGPVVKFARDLSDIFDFELVGMIAASSVPIFMRTVDPNGIPYGEPDEAGNPNRYQSFAPGGVYYGPEEPKLMSHNRPGNNFAVFVERIIRAIGAAAGLPYEVVAKDFSKTNYSSARAALLEAWRVYRLYRSWLERHLCQPLWSMVWEEAWLRGMIAIPAGAPDFYDAVHDWTRVAWIGPARGHIDPVKEMNANLEGLKGGLLTYADVIAEQGGDYESTFDQQQRERRMRESRGLVDDSSTEALRRAAENAPTAPEDRREEADASA